MIKDLLSIFFEIIFFCFKFSSNINANPWLEKDSVKIITDFKYTLSKQQYSEALSLIEFLINRWSKIEFANQKDITKSTN